MSAEPRTADVMEGDVHFAAAMARAHSAVGPGSSPVAGPAVPPPTDACSPWGESRTGTTRAAVESHTAAARVGPTCPITVYAPSRGVLDQRAYQWRPCGKAVERGGLCAHHAEDRDRLAARHP